MSDALHEKREINIYVPAGYTKDTATYDVWYAVDGEWDTRLFTNIFNYVVAMGFAPPSIIVRVPNRYVNGFNLRDRDLTPTRWKDVDSSGGADQFLDFFEKELMPYIRKHYWTNGESALIGSSLGGMFAIYTLLKRPTLFHFYITADPALFFDDNFVPCLAAKTINQIQYSNTVLNIGGRSGASYHYMVRDVMDSVLRKEAPASLHWHSALYDNETHGSSVFKSTYDGIKFAYLGYAARNAQVQPTGGIVVKDRPVRLFVPTDYADMHYTSDGKEPTTMDTKVDEFLIVSEPEKIKVRSFSPSGRYDHDLPVKLRTGDYLSPKKISSKKTVLKLLDSTFRPDGSGIMNGYVSIPKDGYYVLQLTPSEGTKIVFNDSLLLQADAAMGHARQTIILPLRKGNYQLRVEHPSKNASDPALNFGFFSSVDGQDDWWKNRMIRW
ncbi:MAG: hypothetical protein J7578_07120 [Chitinophagaceae bacterium]|nr:hypothetical protein [Chitinophagaceae bacterium]